MSIKFDLKGKYALVTGASMGIGQAIATDLAKEGVNLALCALPSEKKLLQDNAAKFEKDYRIKTWSFGIDLSADDGPKALYEEVKKYLPHLDILVNCAGIDIHGYFHKIPFNIHEKLLKVNVRAYMALTHLALPEMIKRKQGRILNVVSMAAFLPMPFLQTYGACKAFLQSFSEAVDNELRDTGVIVSTLNPNNVDTHLLAELPQDIELMTANPPVSPAFVAQHAVNTIKSGEKVCILTEEDRNILEQNIPRELMRDAIYALLKPRH